MRWFWGNQIFSKRPGQGLDIFPNNGLAVFLGFFDYYQVPTETWNIGLVLSFVTDYKTSPMYHFCVGTFFDGINQQDLVE